MTNLQFQFNLLSLDDRNTVRFWYREMRKETSRRVVRIALSGVIHSRVVHR